jgi:hypothetical protein
LHAEGDAEAREGSVERGEGDVSFLIGGEGGNGPVVGAMAEGSVELIRQDIHPRAEIGPIRRGWWAFVGTVKVVED